MRRSWIFVVVVSVLFLRPSILLSSSVIIRLVIDVLVVRILIMSSMRSVRPSSLLPLRLGLTIWTRAVRMSATLVVWTT